MQPNSPNEPMGTLGNEDTPLKKKLLTPLQVKTLLQFKHPQYQQESQKKGTIKEKRSKDKVPFLLALVYVNEEGYPNSDVK